MADKDVVFHFPDCGGVTAAAAFLGIGKFMHDLTDERVQKVGELYRLLRSFRDDADASGRFSFVIATNNGGAYVEYKDGTFRVSEDSCDDDDLDFTTGVSEWCFTSMDEAAELLYQLGADPLEVEL